MIILTLVLLAALAGVVFLWFKTLRYYDSGKHTLITALVILLTIFSCFFLADICYSFSYNMKHGSLQRQLIRGMIKNLEMHDDHTELLNHLRDLDKKFYVTAENSNNHYETVIDEFIAEINKPDHSIDTENQQHND